ncbi:xylulokinase [Niabella drilacis]|uniref:Xylulokinase n=1 Tax=Niabella drilacis (strain DSM 25811 / CCM 8410 / CCUG 62505 / LMG 26954 / E90) TaxID=1285928 RepID=A0A1G6LAZ6_NIADE|nr:FGGY family carbohydrate kinase [Niabella drilacis]SDC40434.1 xylulokinase [Niabella drilacis]
MIAERKKRFLLGIDIGTSAVKAALVDADTREVVASASFPETVEREIRSARQGWAEQDPEQWWADVKAAVLLLGERTGESLEAVEAIGITYQMHGLVITDARRNLLRDAIIWCDSRALQEGTAALEAIGKERCLQHLLNYPGNFTAAKLAWVKRHEPEVYAHIDKIMLPGDYIALRLGDSVTSTVSMLSEGVFWDFREQALSRDILDFFGFDPGIFGTTQPVFSNHGTLSAAVAGELHMKAGTPITYKAGDQLNNALSLNVLKPGEIATTAGTSGVIYAVTDQLVYDPLSRINGFAHVNHLPGQTRIGLLLCINGAGISNRWIRDCTGAQHSYAQMNEMAATVPAGADGLLYFPFGNGAERMLENRIVQAGFGGIDLNKHSTAHLYRAVQEGIAFAFRYGLDIMRQNGLQAKVVKAGKANLFLSQVFAQVFVNVTGLTLELYHTDASVGAAIGAGIGFGIYTEANAFENLRQAAVIIPEAGLSQHYETIYQDWLKKMDQQILQNKS